MVLLLLTFCLLLLPLWEAVIVLCFVVRYFIPFWCCSRLGGEGGGGAGCFALFVFLVSRGGWAALCTQNLRHKKLYLQGLATL